jgi:Na+/melibiose symporter-like transporter
MTNGQKIMIYVIGLGLVAIVFALLQRQAKDFKKKKIIYLLGGLSIAILMFVFGFWFGPWKLFSLFAVLAIAGVFIENRYIYYCESCGRRQHRLLSKSEFCSKCGKKY